MKRFVIDEGFRYFDQRHVSCETAIVPPVALDCRDVIQTALIVDGDDDEVSAISSRARDVAIEGGKTTLVIADVHIVHKNVSCVVGRADMEERVRMRPGVVVEVALIPKQPF